MAGKREKSSKRVPWRQWFVVALFILLVVSMTPLAPANEPPERQKSAQPALRPARLISDAAQPEKKAPEALPTERETEEPAGHSGEEAPEETGPWQVRESAAVENGYFDDAVFIGDSRMEGFKLYSGLNNAKFLTAVGATVDTVESKATERLSTGEKVSIMNALAREDFSKVYLMLGMNELGWVYPDLFAEHYGKLIDRIREIRPDAVIYIEGILPVTEEKDAEGGYINNARIDQYNQLLQQLAEEKQVWYLDISPAVEDSGGCLLAENSFDGIHLKPDACKLWLKYLKTHTARAE